MQNHTLQQNDVNVVIRHFTIAAAVGITLMIAYAVFEDQIGFTADFGDLQVRAFWIMILPVVIQLTADARRIGRLLGEQS